MCGLGEVVGEAEGGFGGVDAADFVLEFDEFGADAEG